MSFITLVTITSIIFFYLHHCNFHSKNKLLKKLCARFILRVEKKLCYISYSLSP